MSRVERLRIKNAMIIANLISNVIGVAVVILLGRIPSYTVSEELLQLIERTDWWFIPPSMLLPLTLSLIYEGPIRKHFEDLFGGRTSTPGRHCSSPSTARRAFLPHFDRFQHVDRRSDCLLDGGRGRGSRDRSDPEHYDPKPSHRTHHCHGRFLRPGVRAPKAFGPSRIPHRRTSYDPGKLAHSDPNAPGGPPLRLQPRPLYRHPERDSLPTPFGTGTAKFPKTTSSSRSPPWRSSSWRWASADLPGEQQPDPTLAGDDPCAPGCPKGELRTFSPGEHQQGVGTPGTSSTR